MSRAVAVVVALVALVVPASPAAAGGSAAGLAIALGTSPAAASTQAWPTTVPPPPPPPRAWIAVDADTGAVIDGGRHREPMRVASLAKVLTALVIAEQVPPDASVPVSARAAGMPARKMQLLEGEAWRADHLLHALLLASANDAAVALAEHASGSLEAFGAALATSAERLGFADDPVLQDPAGLDDEFSVGGGNLLSARDLAVATRAFLRRPELAAIVAMPEYRFVGGDNEPHVLRNHNRMLRLYPGAIGVKTGYTRRSGHSLVAAAHREGRTVIAVVVGAAEPYRSAALLLDRAFSVPPAAQGDDLERLPPVPRPLRPAAQAKAEPDAAGLVAEEGAAAELAAAEAASASHDDDGSTSPLGPVRLRDAVVLALGGTPAVAILVRRRRQSRRSAEIHPFRI